MSRKFLMAVAALALIGTGVAYSGFGGERKPVEFYKGHTHGIDGHAINAPEHSGGTDEYGCHNASVPYHCH